ncbi:MAG TPA: membrane protein insertase YidC [Kofleriaceae bacterium]|nr:membrane protein insertase YidC [Kofleriaceae bacterium]
MEDQGKRLLIAVAVAFAIMMAWQLLFPGEKPEKKPEEQRPVATEPAAAGAGGAAAGAGTAAGTGEPATAGEAAAPASAPRGPEQTFTFDFDAVSATFTSYGGALSSWKLLGDQFHVPGDESTPDDLVRLRTGETRLFSVRFADGSTFPMPADAEWKGEKTGEREMTFTWSSPDLAVIKRFTIHPESYVVELAVEYKPVRAEGTQALVVTLTSEQDPKKTKKGGWTKQPREWKASCYVDGELESWSAKSLIDRPREERGDIDWAGYVHSYFLVAAAPRAEERQMFGCRAYPVDKAGGMGMDITYPETSRIAPGTTIKNQLVAYLGPKYLDRLEGIAGLAGFDPGFDKAVDLGFWGFIAGPLLWILQHIYAFTGIWGISIILLTMLVKLATLYWTHKSMKSMKAMANLRPQLDKIKEKYKDDRQKQQVETMALFKAHGVNPLAGCLPILLQMPIWFALYRALSVAAELYQAKFLWFQDLTAPDPYFILPVFMTATMLLQSRLTPTTATGAQQKILTYGMPLMFGGFSLFFPAGLTLSISTNTVLTLLHHLYMKKTGPTVPKKVAAGAALAPADLEVEVAAGADDDGPEAATPAAPGHKNGHSARPSGARGQQPRRGGGKRSKRGSKSS